MPLSVGARILDADPYSCDSDFEDTVNGSTPPLKHTPVDIHRQPPVMLAAHAGEDERMRPSESWRGVQRGLRCNFCNGWQEEAPPERIPRCEQY